MECLDDNVASEFVSGSLPKTSVTKVENHLAKCRDCRDLVAALAMSDDDSQAATKPHDKHTPVSEGGGGKSPMRAWAVGDRVGRYLVLSALGAGGMGVVFSAYDPQLDRKVALKLLRTNSGIASKEARARLRREAQAIAQLSHPNVVAVYDVGETADGDVYIAMEFVEGDTLTHWLRKFSRTPREIIDVFLQAARGLYAAHAVGLLHRDFKPDNVLVGGDGRVRVTDFGLARSVLGPDEAPKPNVETTHLHVELTATGTVLGTPRYMPPEQLLGPSIDARSDQFSFCVALYEALYGQHPLPGSTAVSMLEADAKAIPAPEKKGLPAAISRVVMRGLEKDRSKRFPSMAALITELSPRVERTPMRYAAISIAVVVIAGAAAAAVFAIRDKPVSTEIPDKTIAVLIKKLNDVERERRQLAVQVADAAKRDTITQNELAQVKTALEQKNEQYSDLLTQIAQLKSPEIAKVKGGFPGKVVPPPPSQEKLVLDAFASLQFTGCFSEWSERERNKDVDVTVTLTVGPEGVGREASASDAAPIGPSLAFCVQSAATRITYPRGPDELEIKAIVHYTAATAQIAIVPMVLARRTVTAQTIDLKD